MSSTTIEQNIIELSISKDKQPIINFLKDVNNKDIIDMIDRTVNLSIFITILNHLLETLSNSQDFDEKRYISIQCILKNINEGKVKNQIQIVKIVNRVCFELTKLKVPQIIELCQMCTKEIQKGTDTDNVWKELLPVLVNILEENVCVEFNGEELTGKEFKNHLIKTLIMMDWSANIVTSLTIMFSEILLDKDQHQQVVRKLCDQIERMTPQEIPMLIYQLLGLCKKQNSQIIFIKLQSYFNIRIYSNKESVNSDRNSMDVIGDSIDIAYVNAESTILYHVHQYANSGYDTKEYLNTLKTLTKTPEYVLHPFQLTFLLTISTIPFYEKNVFDIIKAAIFRALSDDQKRQESKWVRDMIPAFDDIEKVIQTIIECSVDERDVVVQGLVNLTFVLLSTASSIGREHHVEKMWSIGKNIIKELIKKKRDLSQIIIQKLCNLIITGQNVHQYIRCLQMISKRFGLTFLENQKCIVELIEQSIQVSGPVASEILDVILPLTKLSHTTRDNLILMLRKGLHSKCIETRQMAVVGFIKLIKNLKISNSAALQNYENSFDSGMSVLSQISLTLTGRSMCAGVTNEALCLEILGILRRCFMQQADVKAKLYDNLYETICVNQDLCQPLLELLWSHFSSFYVVDVAILPPLNFSNAIQIKDTDAILTERLGKLIFTIAMIICKRRSIGDTSPMLQKFVDVFEILSTKMTQCDLEHFELDDGTDLLDILPESQKKMLILKEVMSTYEALISYNLCAWNLDSTSSGDTIKQLFTGYCRLNDFSKSLNKKKDKKKKADANKSTENQNETSRKEGGSEKRVFKPPDTVMTLDVASKLLTLLHQTSVDWSSPEQANILKRNILFHQYALQAVHNLFISLKQVKYLEEHKKSTHFDYCMEIAKLLFVRCIQRFDEISEFDYGTALLSLEVFNTILQVVNLHFKNHWLKFLNGICDLKETNINLAIEKILSNYSKLLEASDDDSAQDAEVAKLIINGFLMVGAQIAGKTNCTIANKNIEWMKQMTEDRKLFGKAVVNSFVTFLFKLYTKHKLSTTLQSSFATKLTDFFGRISDEEKEDGCVTGIFNEAASTTVFLCLCNEMKSMLDDVDWIILRIKAEATWISIPAQIDMEQKRESLRSKERSLSCQLCQIISIMIDINDVSMPMGPCCEMVFKINTNLYQTLCNLTKYFTMRSSKLNPAFQVARFNNVVKDTGKSLSPVVNKLILYMDHNQIEGIVSKKKDAKLLKNKVLKETKLLPKLILEMETFSSLVIKLSKKTNIDLFKYVGQGTARDFRIKDLKTVLAEKRQSDENADSSEDEEPLSKRNRT